MNKTFILRDCFVVIVKHYSFIQQTTENEIESI